MKNEQLLQKSIVICVRIYIFVIFIKNNKKIGRRGGRSGTNLLSFISCYETFPSVYYWNTRRVNGLNYTTVVNLWIYSADATASIEDSYSSIQIMIVFKTSKSKCVPFNLFIHIIVLPYISINKKFSLKKIVRYFDPNETHIHVIHYYSFKFFARIYIL